MRTGTRLLLVAASLLATSTWLTAGRADGHAVGVFQGRRCLPTPTATRRMAPRPTSFRSRWTCARADRATHCARSATRTRPTRVLRGTRSRRSPASRAGRRMRSTAASVREEATNPGGRHLLARTVLLCELVEEATYPVGGSWTRCDGGPRGCSPRSPTLGRFGHNSSLETAAGAARLPCTTCRQRRAATLASTRCRTGRRACRRRPSFAKR